jgi:hypothetical protein
VVGGIGDVAVAKAEDCGGSSLRSDKFGGTGRSISRWDPQACLAPEAGAIGVADLDSSAPVSRGLTLPAMCGGSIRPLPPAAFSVAWSCIEVEASLFRLLAPAGGGPGLVITRVG